VRRGIIIATIVILTGIITRAVNSTDRKYDSYLALSKSGLEH
jgi:hypothetical protein